MRDAVITAPAPGLAVMTTPDAPITEVEVHADVLALIEAYTDATDKAMPWSTLLAAAGAVPADHGLLRVGVRQGRGVTATVSDAVTDLLKLGLLVTGPEGLRITPAGCEAVRAWNGAYKQRLIAASDTLVSSELLPRTV